MLTTAALGFVLLSPAVQSRDTRDSVLAEVVFSEVERRLICEHYGAACRQPRPDGDADSDRGAGDRTESKGKGKGKDKGKSKGHGRAGVGSGLPPGLAKRDSLPPGLQKQLDEKGQLPPGLQRRALPDDLRTRLPKRSPGVEIVIVDRDVLLIQAATGLVYDVIAGIVHD